MTSQSAARPAANKGFRIATHLAWLVCLSVLPMALLSLHYTAKQRLDTRERATDHVVQVTRAMSGELGQLVEGARQLLVALSVTQRVRFGAPTECEDLLRDVAGRFAGYLNLAVANPDGRLRCSVLPFAPETRAGDRDYVRSAIATRGFAVSNFQIGRVTGKPTVNFAYPVLDKTGQISGVVIASLSVEEFSRRIAALAISDGAAVTVTDRAGTILARQPDTQRWQGRKVEESPLIQAILRGRSETIETTGLDGVVRLYAIASIQSEGSDVLRVAVGFPVSELVEPLDRMMFGIALAAVLVIAATALLAWWIAGAQIVRPVRQLLAAAEKLASGDRSARAGVESGSRELRALGVAFGDMAEKIRVAEAERRQREQILAMSEARFRAVFEQAAVGIALLAPDGKWLSVNRRLSQILGYSPEELAQLTYRDITHPEDRATDRDFVQRILAGDIDTYALEKRYLRKGGEIVWINLTVGLVREDDGAPAYFIAVVEDIRARKRLELVDRGHGVVLAALARGDELPIILGHLIRHVESLLPDAIGSVLLLDPDGIHLRTGAAPGLPAAFNAAIDGASIGPAEGSCGTAAHRRERVVVADIEASPLWARYLDLARLGQVRACWSEPVLAPNGSVLGTFAVYYRTPHVPTAQDIAILVAAARLAALAIARLRFEERHRNEMQAINRRLQSLSAQVLSAQEDERRMLARELHDEIGQSLTALKLTLQAQQMRPDAATVDAALRDSVQIAGDTLDRVRGLALDLRPAQLDELGLLPALRWNLERQARIGGLHLDIDAAPPADLADLADLPDAVATACYRMAQECMNNVLRHASASKVTVRLSHEGSEGSEGSKLCLVFADDGRGFDAAAVQARIRRGGGLGLLGMEERVTLAGGRLETRSSPGQGTTIKACFPLDGQSPTGMDHGTEDQDPARR